MLSLVVLCELHSHEVTAYLDSVLLRAEHTVYRTLVLKSALLGDASFKVSTELNTELLSVGNQRVNQAMTGSLA
jgi:hypothetical protein